MIEAGEKLEEYREIKPYWAQRLLYKVPVPWGGYLSAWSDISKGDYTCKGWSEFVSPSNIFEHFEYVSFKNGYSKYAPTITRKIHSISINTGREDWGAEAGKQYFVIRFT